MQSAQLTIMQPDANVLKDLLEIPMNFVKKLNVMSTEIVTLPRPVFKANVWILVLLLPSVHLLPPVGLLIMMPHAPAHLELWVTPLLSVHLGLHLKVS
jgi:hypothetical protein